MSAVAVGAAVLPAVARAAVSYGLNSLLNDDSSSSADRANQAAMDSAALTAQIGAEQWDRYKDLYDPLERQFINEAQNYDSPTE